MVSRTPITSVYDLTKKSELTAGTIAESRPARASENQLAPRHIPAADRCCVVGLVLGPGNTCRVEATEADLVL